MPEYSAEARFPDGTAAKLRASCNACNESKVRCSQSKPTCSRCAKNNVTCVYGLSRRSHKDAPRIGASTRQTRPRTSSSPLLQHHAASHAPHVHALDSVSSDPMEGLEEFLVSGADNSPLQTEDIGMDDVSKFGRQQTAAFQLDKQLDAADFEYFDVTGFYNEVGFGPLLASNQLDDGTFTPDIETSSMAGQIPRFVGQEGSALQKGGGNGDSGSVMSSSDATFDQTAGSALTHNGCDCNHRVIEELASVCYRNQGRDKSSCMDMNKTGASQRGHSSASSSFDVRLSELKHAISTLERFTGCGPHSADPMSTLTVGILLGRVIDSFEAMVADAGGVRPSSWSSSSQARDAHENKINNSNNNNQKNDSSGNGNSNSNDHKSSDSTNNDSSSNTLRSSRSSSSDVSSIGSRAVDSRVPSIATATATPMPRFSWGVLQIEADEEKSLKQCLCQLQLRRLGRVMQRFSQSVRAIRGAKGHHQAGAGDQGQTNGGAAFAMVCECMRVWLELRAKTVSTLFVVDDGGPQSDVDVKAPEFQ